MIAALKQSDLYSRMKTSRLYDAYWTLRDRSRIDRRREEVNFYRSLLSGFPRGGLIFDVGANRGDKTDVFLRLGARVVAVEPDQDSRRVLGQKFLQYRFAPKPVAIVGKALSDRIGVETMWVDGPGSFLNTLSKKWVETLRGDKARFAHTSDKLEFAGRADVETTTLEQLITAHGSPFFIKIDVEGYEPVVLRGLQHPVPYLSYEVNLPEFRPEGLESVQVLSRLADDGTFNYIFDTKRGLCENRWLSPAEISRVIERCSEKSIEVFWKTKGRQPLAEPTSVWPGREKQDPRPNLAWGILRAAKKKKEQQQPRVPSNCCSQSEG